MKKIVLYILSFICFGAFSANAQDALSIELKKHNTESVPYITVDKLKLNTKNVILLDAREQEEFKVSHLKNALHIGYENFDLQKTIKKVPKKDAVIVVYCSLGVRSEDIAEKLVSAGYSRVYNLRGGIFEWKNKGNRVYSKGVETQKVHAFSTEWSKWLLKGEKVYE